MWILLSKILKMCIFLKIRHPFSKVKVYRQWILTFEKSKNAHFFKNPPPIFKSWSLQALWILPFENSKKSIFLKIRCSFSKLKVYRHCEFWLLKIQKCAFFKKSAAHFQKLKFTGIVNFHFWKFKKYKFS